METALAIDPDLTEAIVLRARLLAAHAGPIILARVAPRGLLFVVGARSDSVLRLYRRAFFLDPLLELDRPESDRLPVAWRGTVSPALRWFGRHEEELLIAHDRAVLTAVESFPRLAELLAPRRN